MMSYDKNNWMQFIICIPGNLVGNPVDAIRKIKEKK